MAGTRMVVVGGDAAGMSAASQARKRRKPEELEIVAFERGRHTSYSACGLPYYAGDVVKDWRDLVSRTPEEFADQAIEVRTRHEVDAIDLEARRVRVRDLEAGRVVEEPWDLLVVATGSEPLRPPIDGIDLPGVYGLSVLQDGIELRKAIDAGPERAVIVGGGYIGLEAAEALVNRGVPTALVEAAPQVMARIDPDMGELVSKAVRDIGVELYLEEEVAAIEGDGRVRAVRTAERTLEADLVVLGLGTRPAVGLAESSGIQLGQSGAIAVNPRMQTPHDGVWAAGDCAESQPPRLRQAGQLPPGHASPTSRAGSAGINIGGGYATFPGVLGTAVVQGVRRRGRPHRAVRGRAGRASAWSGSRRRSTRPPGPATSRGRPRSGSRCWPSAARAGCWAPRSSARRARPSASTCSPPPSGTAWPSTRWSTWTCPTRRRSRRSGTRC